MAVARFERGIKAPREARQSNERVFPARRGLTAAETGGESEAAFLMGHGKKPSFEKKDPRMKFRKPRRKKVQRIESQRKRNSR